MLLMDKPCLTCILDLVEGKMESWVNHDIGCVALGQIGWEEHNRICRVEQLIVDLDPLNACADGLI